MPEKSTSTILWPFGIWSKLESWKSSISGCLMSWLQIKKKKNHCFEVSFSLILPYNSKPFLDRIVMCNEKWILYDNQWWPTQCLDHEKAPKYFQMPNLHQKISWSLFGSLMPIWYTPDIWIPVKPLHLRSMYAQPVDEMHSTLQHLQPALVNRKGPILLHCDNAKPHVAQPMFQKLNKLGYEILPHLLYLPDLSSTNHHFVKHLKNFS